MAGMFADCFLLREEESSAGKHIEETKAQIVVAVVGVPVVAIRYPAVARVVVPAAAPVHAVGASFRPYPQAFSKITDVCQRT